MKNPTALPPILLLLLLVAVVIGSFLFAEDDDTEQSVSQTADFPTIRIGNTDDISLQDATLLLVIDRLRAAGYDVEYITYTDSAFIAEELVNDSVDIASTTFRNAWRAAHAGGDIIVCK